MDEKKINKFVDFCEKELDFTSMDSQYKYKSLSICLIDCVYSLRAKYFSITVPVVERYAKVYMNGNICAAGDTLDDLIKHIDEAGGCEKFAENVLKNRQKLSGRHKSEVCYELADKLSRLLGINTLEEFQQYNKTELLDIVIRSVKGFGDAGVNYLYMLAGDPNRCKPDVHIHHSVKDAFGEDISNDKCQELFTDAVKKLRLSYPEITVRDLDHLIWNKYQIGNRRN